jgi:hypothetical protein
MAALVLFGWVGAVVARRSDPSHVSRGSKEVALQAGALLGINKKFLIFLLQKPQALREQVDMMMEIGREVNHSTRTIMIDPDAGQALRYYAEIGGRTGGIKRRPYGAKGLDAGSEAQTKVDEWLTGPDPAEFLIVTDLYEFNVRRPELRGAVASRFPVFKEGKSYKIFDLRGHGNASRLQTTTFSN